MRRAGNRELRTSDEFAMRFVDELGGRFEAFRLARSKDEERLRILALQSAEGDEGERFFRGDNAASDDDWRAAAAPRFRFQPIRERGRRGKLEIVFQVTADVDAIARRSESTDVFRIFFTLHEEAAGNGENILQKGPQEETKRAEVASVTRE